MNDFYSSLFNQFIMIRGKSINNYSLSFFICVVTPLLCPAQSRYTSQKASVTIAGTSSLHDWTEKSQQGSGVAVFNFAEEKLTLNGLSFVVPVKSLKSEHSSMDNNTYKALKADKNPNITYIAHTASITRVNAETFSVKTTGKLTIAGTTNDTDISATVKVNADKSITVSGSKKFKMTDYKVDPPTAVLGTIKTGDEITISFDCRFIKQQ
jgi:polyisoprenoid-binding protein YceI